MANNIINFEKYKPTTVKTVAAKPTHFPIIYALETPSGDPLIMFRFVKIEDEQEKQAAPNNVVEFKHKANHKKQGAV